MELEEELIQTAEKAEEKGVNHLRRLNDFYEECLELIEKLEEQKIRAEELKNRDLVVRGKHSKKMAKTVKKIVQLFDKINQSFLKNQITEEQGKLLAEALRKARNEGVSTISKPSCPTCHRQRLRPLAGTTSQAREKLSQLDDEVVLYQDYAERKNWLRQKTKELKKEIKKKDEQISRARKRKKLREKVRREEDLIKDYEKTEELLDEYEKLREEKLEEITRQPLSRIISLFLKDDKAVEAGFPRPADSNALKELSSLLRKDFSQPSPEQVLEYADYNQKKLSHLTPQPQKLKKLVHANASWLSHLVDLEGTSFLHLDWEDSEEKFRKVMTYWKNNEPRRILEQVLELKTRDLQKAQHLLRTRERADRIDVPPLDQLAEEKKKLKEELSQYQKIKEEHY